MSIQDALETRLAESESKLNDLALQRSYVAKQLEQLDQKIAELQQVRQEHDTVLVAYKQDLGYAEAAKRANLEPVDLDKEAGEAADDLIGSAEPIVSKEV